MRLLVVLGCCAGMTAIAAAADLTVDQAKIARSVNDAVKQAGVSYSGGDIAAAGRAIKTAMSQVDLAVKDGSPDLLAEIETSIRRIEKAHTLLEFEGVSLPPLWINRPQAIATTPTVPKPGRRSRRPTRGVPPQTPSPGISFTNAIAPILIQRCGRCHIGDSKGNFSMATFSALMKGPPEGVVIFAGDVIASRLIETIETGDMPRGRDQVTPMEIQTLKAWILAGARFDGEDPNASLAGSAPSPDNPPDVPVRRATGKETISFAADVAPLLVENCNGCHIDSMRNRGGLRMDTFAQLLRGGDTGAVIEPGRGNSSLLVQKLRGMVGQRMPAGGRPSLSEESIRLIATWIDEGASLDGASERQPLGVMSQLAWASSATSDQLSVRRAELAAKSMRLVESSGRELPSQTTDHFLVIGSASADTIDLVARVAETQMKAVKTVVSGKSPADFFRGRSTLFVLPKRYDYSEFAKMVESRDVPSTWSSHWRYDGIDGYVCLVATDGDDKQEIARRLTAPLISLSIATRGGDVPRWLAEGVGVAAANRIEASRDRELRRRRESETATALAAMTSAKDFLQDRLTPDQTDRIAAAIGASLLDRTRRRGFSSLLRFLDEGEPFEQAFQRAFRASPEQFIDAWMRWARGE